MQNPDIVFDGCAQCVDLLITGQRKAHSSNS